MRIAILSILTALAALPQAQTPLRVFNSSGSLTGQVWLQERRTNGENWLKLEAPQNIASDFSLIFPNNDGNANDCIVSDGSGTLSFSACQERLVSNYNWSQTLGSLSAPGTVTVTFTGTACPAAATDSLYVARIYESVTPTTYSLHTQNGAGTCTRGGAGTLIFTAVGGTYTNAVITSANSGWQEAMFSVADSLNVRLRAGTADYYIYSDVLTEDRNAGVICDQGATLIPMVDNVKVFNVASPFSIRTDGCAINNAYAHTGTTGVYLNNPDGSNFGGRIERMTFTALENGIHAVTGYLTDILNNRIFNPTNAAIWMENVDTGDGGAGIMTGNNSSCAGTCPYGLLWNSPGALQFKNNGFNGFTTQAHLQPIHGYASTAWDGSNTVVTWQNSGVATFPNNRFRTTWAIGSVMHLGGTDYCTITSITSSSSLKCSQNLGTLSTRPYYHGTSSQVQVMNNLFDGGANTTYAVRWVGNIAFGSIQIEGNYVANYAVTTAKAISLEGTLTRVISVKNNNLASAVSLGTTVGINATGGSEYHIEGNQVYGYDTCLNIGSGAALLRVEANRCSVNATATIVNASASATILEGWNLLSGNVYRTTGRVGIGLSVPLQTLDVLYTSASPATSGTAQTGIARVGGDATNAIDIGAYAGSPYGMWFQTNNVLDLSVHYPIILNPLGGNVGIAKTSPTSTLDITGTFAVSSTSILSGNVTMGGTLSMSGNQSPAIDGLGSIGLSGTRYGAMYSYTGNFAGLLTAGAGLTVAGTITFPTGTTGHCWINSGSGVGGWAACAASTAFIQSGNSFGAQAILGTNDSNSLAFETNGTTKMTLTTSGFLGIAITAPKATLDVFYNSASPATSGTTQTGIARIGGDAGNVLDVGAYLASPYGSWLQTNNAADLSVHYPIILNPLGGNVGIGMTNPTSTLHVTGTFAASSTSILSGNVTMGGTLSMSGNQSPAVDGNGSIGLSATRYGAMYSYTGNFAGTLTTHDIVLASGSTYNIGSSGAKLLDLHTNYVDLYTDLTMNSGSTFTGSFIPSTNNLYSIGNTSFRLSTVVTVNANFSGTLTAPSGNTGLSSTISVRKGDDSAACNIVVSGGLITSTTC